MTLLAPEVMDHEPPEYDHTCPTVGDVSDPSADPVGHARREIDRAAPTVAGRRAAVTGTDADHVLAPIGCSRIPVEVDAEGQRQGADVEGDVDGRVMSKWGWLPIVPGKFLRSNRCSFGCLRGRHAAQADSRREQGKEWFHGRLGGGLTFRMR